MPDERPVTVDFRMYVFCTFQDEGLPVGEDQVTVSLGCFKKQFPLREESRTYSALKSQGEDSVFLDLFREYKDTSLKVCLRSSDQRMPPLVAAEEIADLFFRDGRTSVCGRIPGKKEPFFSVGKMK